MTTVDIVMIVIVCIVGGVFMLLFAIWGINEFISGIKDQRNEAKEKNAIKKIRKKINRLMPDNPEGDEHITGERMAYQKVLDILDEYLKFF